MATHTQWKFYLILGRSSQLPMLNGKSQTCAVNVLTGLGPELPNANEGQYAGLSHSRACAVGRCFTWSWTGVSNWWPCMTIPAHAQWVDVLPGLGPELSNTNVGQYAGLLLLLFLWISDGVRGCIWIHNMYLRTETHHLTAVGQNCRKKWLSILVFNHYFALKIISKPKKQQVFTSPLRSNQLFLI